MTDKEVAIEFIVDDIIEEVGDAWSEEEADDFRKRMTSKLLRMSMI